MLLTGLSTLLAMKVSTSRWHFKHFPVHLRQIVSENIPAQKPKALLPFMATPSLEALGRTALKCGENVTLVRVSTSRVCINKTI